MGFNLSGIVLNKSYKENLVDLTRQFNWNLQFENEISFEIASENWKDEGICDIYFSENGTILFVNMDMCIEPWSIKDGNVLTFALSETSMAFNLNYCVGQEIIRSIMEVNGEAMNDKGQKLSIESTAGDTSEIIWGQIGEVIGKPFWDIQPNEKAFRYRFITKEDKVKNAQNLDTTESIPSNEEINLMIQNYKDECSNKVIEITTFIDQNKKTKNRDGKMGYLCKTVVEFSNENLNLLNQHDSISNIERITNDKFGPGYLITFKTQKTSFGETIKNLFSKK